MASPVTDVPREIDVDKILSDVTALHEKLTGRPYDGEAEMPLPTTPGVDPSNFLDQEYRYLMNLVSSGALRSPFSMPYTWAPPVEVFETAKEYWVRIDLPGVTKDDLSVKAHGNVLRLEGERPFRRVETDCEYLIMERAYGRFVKEIPLTETADAASAEARLTDGVLEVRIPRRELGAEAELREINIR